LKYSYSPFGKSKILYTNFTSEALFLYKPLFSDHYQMDFERLIDMKGRIYDTVFMRFLSPDAFIQDIYHIQNLNRYSYALNNPFKFKDPSGFSWKSFWKAITNFKVIAAIAMGVATAGLASAVIPVITAGATSIGLTSSIAASAISGAVIGSAGAFGSSMVLTNGNFEQSFNAAMKGALVGGFSAGFTSPVKQGLFNGNALKTFGGQLTYQGIGNVLQKKKFTEGMELSIFSFAAANAYKSLVGYEVTIESGGEAVQKGFNSPPVKDANNIGIQGKAVDPKSLFNEGGAVSRIANKIGGINAISGLHDTFQINSPGASRDLLNIPGMPVAAYFTYFGLYNKIQCPLC
jgi:RHS repeat-associated protein